MATLKESNEDSWLSQNGMLKKSGLLKGKISMEGTKKSDDLEGHQLIKGGDGELVQSMKSDRKRKVRRTMHILHT